MNISTEKKLELLRDIRMENQKNRQLMMSRQRILGLAPSMDFPEEGNINHERAVSPMFRGLRFRIFVSFLLLGVFIIASKLEWHYQDFDCDYVMHQINDTISLDQLLSDGKALLNHEKTGIK